MEEKDILMKSIVEGGMRIDWDAPIRMDDGVVLRADVFRPNDDGKYPVIITYGPYGKGVHFSDGYPMFWNRILSAYPEILEGTSGKYMNWETVDPEKWVPNGYVIVRVDSRGAGRSPGYIDNFSAREVQDYYQCIEWAGVQGWSNGKVGLLGISYYAMMQWRVASLQPSHLVAICPFEGCFDHYRDAMRHGGIKHDMFSLWYPVQVENVQHGLGVNGSTSRINGELVSGPETLSSEELRANRTNLRQDVLDHEWITDEYYTSRFADIEKINVPILSCGNWGGNALHLRGNLEGYMRATSDKWLEIHGLEHFTEFYTNYGYKMQRAFMDHFLQGKDTWHQAPVHLKLRNVDGTFTERDEQEWPLARTQWTKMYFDVEHSALSTKPVEENMASFEAMGDGITLLTEPLEKDTEITGPLAAKIFISSSTEDADIFLTLRVLDPEGKDVTFIASNDPNGVITTGWLRASHRKTDSVKSLPYRPWHTHDEKYSVTPGETYELDIEIWPTSINVPKGYRIGIAVMGRDFEFKGEGPWPRGYGIDWKGNALYVHQDKEDRKPELYGGTTTIISGGKMQSYLLLPIIP